MGSKAKNWCLTINNPESPYDTYFKLENDITYAVWQLEEGSCLHIQAYLQFSKKKRMRTVRNLFPTAHLTVARGTAVQNKTYCTKDRTRLPETSFYEIGVSITLGQRTDLEAIRKLIVENTSELDIAENHFSSWTRNYRAFREYRFMIQPKKDWPIAVIVLCGPTDIGKSRYIHEHASLNGPYYKQCNKDWFTHYNGQTDVVIDEFYGSRMSYSYLLQLTDRYPFQVGTKGGEVNFIPKRIWMSSNKMPWEWYPNCPYPALERRISVFISWAPGEILDTDEIDEKLKEAMVYDY